MNTERLLRIITAYSELSPGLLADMEAGLKEEYYKSHQILNAEGQQENRMYFIAKGLIRNYYYDQQGNEHTVRFWDADDILFSCQGYYAVPSYYYTEVIETSVLITLTYALLRELDKKYPEVGELMKILLLRYQQQEYENQKLMAMPPEERYRALRKSQPALFKKVPARIIASYLHLTRETLARYIARH